MTRRAPRLALVFAAALVAAGVAAVYALNQRGEAPLPADPTPLHATLALIERGAYLARAGNCTACHTARGGAPYAGGRGIDTPFGTVYASNLTPDAKTGIGSWSADHFWRALHNGRSKDGRLLSPAFPYPNYTLVTRDDSDAIYAYLRSLPPVEQPNRAHALRFPYDSQLALSVWRALFFEPSSFAADPARSTDWNRGAYLVRGLGHCNACHASRNALGATTEKLELSGGLIPMQNWYAPSLSSSAEAGVAGWPVTQVVELLKTGRSERASVTGPMAEVVFRSTQHLSDADLRAMAVFLGELPQSSAIAIAAQRQAPDARQSERGKALYDKHCADCHGDAGQGAVGAYPPLAGNRAVTLASPVNLIRIVQNGGFLPATAGNPRPYGMPPFSHLLDDTEIAAVLSYIRSAWGNAAPPVSQLDVLKSR